VSRGQQGCKEFADASRAQIKEQLNAQNEDQKQR
jgi:hypothetical protein